MRAALGVPGGYRAGQKPTKRSISAATPEPSSQDNAAVAQPQHAPSAFEAENFADFLEPAVEGPPSPGRLRALNNKVKQASVSERHVSQQTASSGSSSLLSLSSADRRPSWDHTLDSLSLSRKSSTRSTTSSMRERPESVQSIGKTIFHRRSKFRRESISTRGSSNPTDGAADGAGDRPRTMSISREYGLSKGIFSRRKTVQAVEVSPAQKKPQISGPFNFQHVAQIHRDHLPSIGRASQAALQDEFSTLRAPPRQTTGLPNTIQAENLRLPNFSSRATCPHDDDDIAPDVVPREREDGNSRPPSWQESPTRQTVKQTRSQDRVPRMAPPRPPRSPMQMDFNFAQPMPPRRSSRRPSIPRRDSEALVNMAADRSQAISGFSFPAPPPPHSEANRPPSTAYDPPSPTTTTERRYSRIFAPSPLENPNWPLACPSHNASTVTFEAALPDVPEEEEQYGIARSRAGTPNTNSPLRGSQSVPALRKLSHDRSLSRESAIFGHFDMAAAQRAVMESMLNSYDDAEPLPRDAWEDVIDYCYEHEAEADCDYDWDRPSINQDMEPTFLVTDDEMNDAALSRSTPDRFEPPALSPSGHLFVGSARGAQEAMAPMISATATKSPTRNHFSLPRREAVQPKRLVHVRTTSQASSFKESDGFTLSPSMFIPNDYHQEMLAHQAEQDQEPDSPGQAITFEDSRLFVPARSSASTTTSIGTSRSEFDRHISTISANTDYTRLTMSTSSLNIEDYLPKDDEPQAISTEDKEIMVPETVAHARSQSIAGLLNTSDPRHLSRDNHNSDPNLAGMRLAKSPLGRGRSRTMSTPPPPGQYGLFPRPANLK